MNFLQCSPIKVSSEIIGDLLADRAQVHPNEKKRAMKLIKNYKAPLLSSLNRFHIDINVLSLLRRLTNKKAISFNIHHIESADQAVILP